MAMKLKLDEAGHVVVQNDKPVYVYDDGKEIEADVEGMFSKIAELNTEAKTHRLKAKEVSEKLEQYGDMDPAEIDAFLDTIEGFGGIEGIEKLKASKNVDIESIKKQITEVWEGKVVEANKLVETKDAEIRKLLVSNGFSSSKYVDEKLLIPADIVEATFGKHFKVEDGQVVAYLGDNKILSREKPGEVATMDEALAAIVDSYPMKDRIMKASGGGSGAPGGGNGASHDPVNSISREQFNGMDLNAQSQFALNGGTVAD